MRAGEIANGHAKLLDGDNTGQNNANARSKVTQASLIAEVNVSIYIIIDITNK